MGSSLSCNFYFNADNYFKYMDVYDTLYITFDMHIYEAVYIYTHMCLPKKLKC